MVITKSKGLNIALWYKAGVCIIYLHRKHYSEIIMLTYKNIPTERLCWNNYHRAINNLASATSPRYFLQRRLGCSWSTLRTNTCGEIGRVECMEGDVRKLRDDWAVQVQTVLTRFHLFVVVDVEAGRLTGASVHHFRLGSLSSTLVHEHVPCLRLQVNEIVIVKELSCVCLPKVEVLTTGFSVSDTDESSKLYQWPSRFLAYAVSETRSHCTCNLTLHLRRNSKTHKHLQWPPPIPPKWLDTAIKSYVVLLWCSSFITHFFMFKPL